MKIDLDADNRISLNVGLVFAYIYIDGNSNTILWISEF